MGCEQKRVSSVSRCTRHKATSSLCIGDSLLFASEIKAFHAHDSYNPHLDELSLALRLSWEYTMDSSTLIKGFTR